MSGECMSLQLLEGGWVNMQNTLEEKKNKQNLNNVLKHNDVV